MCVRAPDPPGLQGSLGAPGRLLWLVIGALSGGLGDFLAKSLKLIENRAEAKFRLWKVSLIGMILQRFGAENAGKRSDSLLHDYHLCGVFRGCRSAPRKYL